MTEFPRTFGPYFLVDEIARGASGTIFRARPRLGGSDVALKALRDPSPDAALVSRFRREAQMAARLRHPNIVAVLDAGEFEGRFFYTMPLIEGRPLAPGPDAPALARLLATVARAVHHAHERGVIHRDLKPTNILVRPDGEPMITDFGVARDQRRATHLTTAGELLGTPAYMAPEQAAGEAAGFRADVYSLGAMLYELLAGGRPYEGQGGSGFDELLARVRAEPPASLESVAPRAAPELAAVCRKAMARDPRERYASADELAAELRAYLEGRVVRAYANGAVVELRKWVQRNRALAAALAAVVLCAVGGLGAVSLLQARGKAEILRLADARRLAELDRRAEALWPARPANVEGMRAWLAEAEELARRRELHGADLERLRTDPQPDRAGGAELRWRIEALAGLVADLGEIAEPERGLIASVRERMTFAQEITGPIPAGVEIPPVDPNAPSLFTAMQEQLGLKLEPTKGPVEVVIVQSVSRPTPD